MRRNRRIAIIATMVLAGLGLMAIYHLYAALGPRQFHYIGVASTSLEQERIGSLYLGQSLKELKPVPTPDRNNDMFDYYTWVKDVTLATNLKEDAIIRIFLHSGNPAPTAKGVRIGDSKESVFQAYGKQYYKRNELGLPIIGYIDKKLHHTIEFWIADGKVDLIRLDLSSMD